MKLKSDKESTEHTRICINIYHQSNTETTHPRTKNSATSPNKLQHKEKNKNDAEWNNSNTINVCLCCAGIFFFKTSWSKALLLTPPRGCSNNRILAVFSSFQQQRNADVIRATPVCTDARAASDKPPERAVFWCSYVKLTHTKKKKCIPVGLHRLLCLKARAA